MMTPLANRRLMFTGRTLTTVLQNSVVTQRHTLESSEEGQLFTRAESSHS